MRFTLMFAVVLLALASVQADNCWDRCGKAVQKCQSDAKLSSYGKNQGSSTCPQVLQYCLGTCYSDSLKN